MATVDLKSISHLLNAAGVATETPADGDHPSTSERAKETERWESVFSQLLEWQKSAGYENEDGYVSPSTVAISTASNILHEMRKEEFPRPSKVIMNGDGGIVVKFAERESGKTVFEIEENGEVEMRRYQSNRVVSQTDVTL